MNKCLKHFNYLLIILLVITKDVIAITKPILIISIPKCGTHLLGKVFYLIFENLKKPIHMTSFIKFDNLRLTPNQIYNNKIYTYHLYYTHSHSNALAKSSIQPFFIYRDPRDQVVSFAFHLKNRDAKYKYKDISLVIKELIVDSQAYKFISNKIHNINDLYKNLIKWQKVNTVITLKYEDLIGPLGNGSLVKQYETLLNINKAINTKLTKTEIIYIQNHLFGNEGIPYNQILSPQSWELPPGHWTTFRQGKVGEWKNFFNSEHIKLFKKITGNLLIKLGYEKNMEW